MLDPSVSEIARWTLRALAAFVKSEPTVAVGQLPNPEAAIARSVSEALQWGLALQVFGMPKAKDPRTDAIPLRLSESQRRFKGPGSQVEVDEEYLDRSSSPIVLLGDPGAGKTTTLKRLVQRLILDELDSTSRPGTLPIVVRIRELTAGESIVPRIAEAIGLHATTLGDHVSSRIQRSPEESWDKTITITPTRELWIGQMRARDAVAQFLSNNHAVLIFDGLDEAAGNADLLKNEIMWLARNAMSSQVIVSSRTGDFHSALEGFEILEICPLSNSEIEEICRKYTPDPNKFMHALTSTPYRDLADRPLFLVQLLLLFNRYKYLPPQPADVYPMIVVLILQEWDAQREVPPRSSKYANFTHERKRAFLAALSYQLTFRVRSKTFSHSDLLLAYGAVNTLFGLPNESAVEVVTEIESHTGLLVTAGVGLYEFSHLSLQEYLAAEYMSKEAYSVHLHDYLEHYPAPVAISIALASDAGISFAAVFLGHPLVSPQSIASFLRRLLQERPTFGHEAPLGVAMLRLFGHFGNNEEVVSLLWKCLNLPGVRQAVANGFSHYSLNIDGDRLDLLCAEDLKPYDRFKTPQKIGIERAVLNRLMSIVGRDPYAISYQRMRDAEA